MEIVVSEVGKNAKGVLTLKCSATDVELKRGDASPFTHACNILVFFKESMRELTRKEKNTIRKQMKELGII